MNHDPALAGDARQPVCHDGGGDGADAGNRLLILGRAEVESLLDYDGCIAAMRDAMIALSRGQTRQLLRTIIDLGEVHAFGIMPGAIDGGTFGAKLISIYHENFAVGKPSHQGVVTLFDPADGAPIAIIDASELTAIRTAAASAAATAELARPGPSRLAILGYGEQAWRHACAVSRVRPITGVSVWGRSTDKAHAFAVRVTEQLGMDARAFPTVRAATRDADIICTTTGAADPILGLTDVKPGVHINAVGSGRAGPAEIDEPLVAACRFIADHRPGVLAQGAEFLNAKAKGLVGDDHVIAEIGEVMDGRMAGRTGPDDITIYKSLGHIVQDLAAGWLAYRRAVERGAGVRVAF